MGVMDNMGASSWEDWKKTLGKAVGIGETLHISNNQMSNIAEKIGDYLSDHVNPDIPENKSLKELWDVANPDEQKAIASCMVKLVNKD